MSGNDVVRIWKDPDERGEAAHPAGEIDLAGLSGGAAGNAAAATERFRTLGCCGPSFDYQCPVSVYPYVCPIPFP